MTEQLKILINEKQFRGDKGFYNDDNKLIKFVCADCDFYKPGDEALECFAFKIMKNLLRKGIVTPEEVLDAIREE
jgi:hypothetical protein